MKIVFNSFLLLFIVACSDQGTSPNITKTKTASISASGELISSDNAIISPPQAKGMWQYKITFMAPEGKMIEKGQPLIGFDTSQLQQRLRDKQNELRRASKKFETRQLENDAKSEDLKLQLAEAQMEFEKAERKWRQSEGLESQINTKRLALEYQLADDNLTKYKRTLAKSKETSTAQLATIENDILRLTLVVKQYTESVKKMMIKAPKVGIVVYITGHNGEKISIGDTVWMGRQLIELPSLKAMMIKAEILEADAGKIAVGQEVDIILDAASDRVFKGKVEKLGTVFRRKSLDQPNIIFDADISINLVNTEIMRPGMSARLKIFTPVKADAANE